MTQSRQARLPVQRQETPTHAPSGDGGQSAPVAGIPSGLPGFGAGAAGGLRSPPSLRSAAGNAAHAIQMKQDVQRMAVVQRDEPEASEADAPTNDGSVGPTADNARDDGQCAPAADGGQSSEPRYDDEGGVCTGDGGQQDGAAEKDPAKKDDGTGVEADTVPIQWAGISFHLKGGSKGGAAEVQKEIALPSVKVPLATGVTLALDNKIKLAGTLSLKQGPNGTTAEGSVSVTVTSLLSIQGGLPWAYVYTGGKLEAKATTKYENGSFGPITGGVDGSLVIGAQLKLPFNDEPDMSSTKSWTHQGGLKFEYTLAKCRLCDFKISRDGASLTWAGPAVNLDELKKINDDYASHRGGGGASGAAPTGRPDTGAGGAPTE